MKRNGREFCIAAALLALLAGPAASVVINEMELNPPDGDVDWIEIYNPDNQSVDISSWTAEITDGSWTGQFESVPAGTILPPQGFYVFNGLEGWAHDDGGYASLYSASGEILDKTAKRLDGMNNDFTYGRSPDGYDTDKDADWGLRSATKGSSNIR
ncbi:MAG TPA: lamin tail domain-containing protein [Methanothrix sp.]|nr:lamin tail domain-containing protein [Methanothrix sp.]